MTASRIKKPVIRGGSVDVIYDDTRWCLLKKLRSKAEAIMKTLCDDGLNTIAHGSLARGDVDAQSDVDVVIPYVVPSFKVELALEKAGFHVIRRLITMATPYHALKAHLYLDELTTVTFPLVKLNPMERDFYRFGGEVTLDNLVKGVRVPGIDKRLMLIEPTPIGHREIPIRGIEAEVARKLGVSINVVLERERVLIRRDKIGRTGVYVKRYLMPHEGFEEVLESLADRDPAIKRLIKQRE
ncbi:MAG: nucleotidyltransferase domain-containing protein [Candidatus Nezhaarchaeales archaeon]